jgi:excisionase family DNA binding protein
MVKWDEVLAKLEKIESLLADQQPPPLTLSEAATYLHVSKTTLYRMTSQSLIAHFKPNGKKCYFLKADLDAYLTRNRVRSREEVERNA